VHQQGPPSPLFAKLLDRDSIMAAVKARIIPLLVEQVRSEVRQVLAA
jgi:hypothetical protein